MKINKEASLKKFNTFNVSETANFIYEVEEISELKGILSDSKGKILILGGGSNILFTKRFEGTIINLKNKGIKVISENKDSILVEVCAGENWNDFVIWAVENNYGGIENLSLIPGNVGAAPIQNIGAYGVELKDIFYSCSGIELDSLKEFEMNKSECKFSYRNSIFKNELKDKVVITSIKLNLTKDNHHFNIAYKDLKENLSNSELSLKVISDEVIKIRQSKLPDHKSVGNCGSFFKNPIVSLSKLKKIKAVYPNLPSFKIDSNNYKIPAAWLIEKSGFKERGNKNVGVYENQPLVIINHGSAKGKEILDFANEIKETIYNNFNIQLEEEVLII
jgi:UDP-N-acetylmuramate dehydrogenase